MKKSKYNQVKVPAESYNSEENILRTYLNEINRIPLLRKEEEEKVAALAVMGNQAAREKLINANLRFVIMIAKKYQGKGLPLEDLINEGNIGLMSAIKHFDVEKGYRFITYAVWWIRQAIIKAIHEKSRMIRLPLNKTTQLAKFEKTRETISSKHSVKEDEEIREAAVFLDMSQERANDLAAIGHDVLSLDDPATTFDSALTIKDCIEDDYTASPVEHAVNRVLRDDLEKVLGGLNKRAAEVIRCRYGLGDSCPLTLKEIGDRYNLSRERVRQIEKRALIHIQRSPGLGKLDSYIA